VGLLLSPTHQQGYTWESIRSYLRGCAQFGQGKAELYGTLGTSGRIQTENYGFKVFAVPSALLNRFSGHFTVQLDQIYNIGSLFHGHTPYCRTRCYA
jgi:hypothetical protein